MCHVDDRVAPDGRTSPLRDVSVPLAGPPALPALLAEPAPGSARQAGTVLIVSDVYGPIPFYRDIAGMLAEAGHTVLLPDMFFRLGPLPEVNRDAAIWRARQLDQEQALADLEAAIDWLAANRGSGDEVTVIGFCLGGTFALDLTARREGLSIVAYYPFPAGWPGTNDAPAPLDILDQLRGPILAFWGQEDYMDMDAVNRFDEAMRAGDADYEATIYPGAGHGFLGTLADDDPAATDSWKRTLEFVAQRAVESV